MPPTIVPKTLVPLTEDNRFSLEMQEKGYTIHQAGAIEEDGYIYTAYVFFRDSSGFDTPQDTWVLAFYRFDGDENILIGTAYPPFYTDSTPSYPRYYQIGNWDHPYNTVNIVLRPGADLRPGSETQNKQNLRGFSSDINHNGRPEFVFFAGYCPFSCSRQTIGLDFYEIQSSAKVVNLAEGMPGHLSLEPFLEDPLVYEVNDSAWYGDFFEITVPYFFAWDGEGYVDITWQYQDEILSRLEVLITSIKSEAGQQFGGERMEANLLQVVEWYQYIGKRRQGLETLIELADEKNWIYTDEVYDRDRKCWLQLVRARASEALEGNEYFNPPRPVIFWYFPDYIREQINSLDQTKYDLSACAELLPSE